MAADRMKHLLCASLILWSSNCYAVDRNNFKTCEQSSFCRRQRKFHPDVSPYRALLDTLEISHAAASLNLLHEKTQVLLKLEICGLEDNTVRFRITELETKRPRFEASDVLVKSPRTYRLSVEKQTTEELMLLGRDSLRISVSAHPFRIDVLSGGELVTSVNARGLLLFEHSRTRGNTLTERVSSTVGSMWTKLKAVFTR